MSERAVPSDPKPLFGGPVTRERVRRFAGSPDQVVGVDLVEMLEGDGRGVRLAYLRPARSMSR